jgi:hypothetical protein
MEEQILPSLDGEIKGERHGCQLETVPERLVATFRLLSTLKNAYARQVVGAPILPASGSSSAEDVQSPPLVSRCRHRGNQIVP